MSRFTKKDSGENKGPAGRADYREKLRIRRQKNMTRILVLLALFAFAGLAIRIQYANHVYTGYDIINSVDRKASVDTTDVRLNKCILTYSKDGAHCTDAKGNVLWNQTYEIQDIKVAINKGTVAIGHYNGREIYILNEKEQLGTITTNLPIRNLCVSENGCVTAILADTDVTRINTYNSNGQMIYMGQAHMSNSGYPFAAALSPDANLLALSYIYVDAGTVKTTVAFFNFGSVGDNYKDCLVSGFDYTDVLVPKIGFISNSCAYAVGDSRLMMYKGQEQPATEAEYLFDQEILAVYDGEGYVGLVFSSDRSDSRYKLNVYNDQAKQIGTYYFNMEYTDIVFEKNDFVIYNASQCLIQTYEGKVKYNGDFLSTVNALIPTDDAYKYLLVGNNSLNTIQLK